MVVTNDDWRSVVALVKCNPNDVPLLVCQIIRQLPPSQSTTELKRIEKRRSQHQGREGTPTPTLGSIGLNLNPLVDIIL